MARRTVSNANLVPGIKPGKTGVVQVESNLHQLTTALAAATTELNTDIDAAILSAKGQIVTRARKKLELGEVRRPSESGEGADGRRQTGRFTFGSGSTFESRTIKISDTNQGFGFPDVARADERTEGAWRAIEWGIPGARSGPRDYHFSGMEQFFITKKHRLPKRFQFTSTSPSLAILKLNVGPVRTKPGAGYEGKHFIEKAWQETLEVMTRDYRRITNESFKGW